MMKNILFALLTLFCCNALILAQENNRIAYGETVQGEITVRQYEAHYTFEGQAGDIIQASLNPRRSSSMSDLNWSNWYHPELILLDARLDVIVALHSYNTATVLQELPETGEYHLIVTGWGGRNKNVGKFDLLLEQVPLLENGAALACEASSGASRHYAVRAESDFAVSYHHIDGDFRPVVSVSVIDNDPYRCGIDSDSCSREGVDSNMYDIAALSGSWLESGAVEVKANDAHQLYIVQVAKSEWHYSNEDETANITLELNISES